MCHLWGYGEKLILSPVRLWWEAYVSLVRLWSEAYVSPVRLWCGSLCVTCEDVVWSLCVTCEDVVWSLCVTCEDVVWSLCVTCEDVTRIPEDGGLSWRDDLHATHVRVDFSLLSYEAGVAYLKNIYECKNLMDNGKNLDLSNSKQDIRE